MDFLSSGLYAVVDLDSGKISEERLDDDLLRETLGGVGMGLSLYQRYESQEPIVLGTGLLTGTLAPAACLGFATAASPRTKRVVHVPFTLYSGLELKLTGFDFVVIVGKAASPKYLWLHDGMLDLRDATALWGKDVWNTVDQVRKTIGEDQIQVLTIGRAGEMRSDLAQISMNYWCSPDRFGLGSVFGAKNLKAVALRGLGSMEVDDAQGFQDEAVAQLEELGNSPVAKLRGLSSLLGNGPYQAYAGWLEPLVHRHRACFNCPAACNTFLKYNERPSALSYKGTEEPGSLIADFEGMLALWRAGYGAEDAARLLEQCSRLGVDAVAVGAAAAQGRKVAAGEDWDNLLSGAVEGPAGWPWDGAVAPVAAMSPFSTWSVPAEIVANRPLTGDVWLRNSAVGHILGICPLFLTLAPSITGERLAQLVNLGTGWQVSAQELEQAAERLIEASFVAHRGANED